MQYVKVMTRKKYKLKKTAFDIYKCCRHKKSRTDDGHQKSLSKGYLEKIIEYLSREYRTQNCRPTCSVGEKSAECTVGKVSVEC